MYFVKIFLFFLFTNILLSCNVNSKKEIEQIPNGQKLKVPSVNMKGINLEEIIIDDFDKNLSTNIVNQIEYIKLESSDQALFGAVDKLICTDDRIYVLDNTLSHNLFIFLRNGKFVSKILNIGEGPNEIKQPYDFFIDDKKQEIAVYDGVLRKIVFYDYDLKPKSQKKIFARVRNIRKISRNSYLVATAGNKQFEDISNDRILTLDSSFNVIKKGIPFDKSYNKELTVREYLHQDNKERCFWASELQKNIFSFDSSGNVVGGYRLNFDKEEIPKEIYKKPASEIFKYSQDQKKYFYLGDFEANQTTTYFKLTTRLIKDQIIIFKDNQSGKIKYGKITMDNKKIPFFSYPIASYKDKFCTIIESSLIKSLSNPEFNAKLDISEELLKIAKATKEEDNPIIQLYKISL